MNNTKKITCLIILFLGTSTLIIEMINNFKDTKTFIASFNPKDYYYKDYFVVDNYSTPSSSSGNVAGYVLYGRCELDNFESSIRISEDKIDNGEYDLVKVPIWRIKTASNSVLIRNKNKISAPFSYNMRNYWINLFNILLILPALVYYLYLRNKENKKKENQ